MSKRNDLIKQDGNGMESSRPKPAPLSSLCYIHSSLSSNLMVCYVKLVELRTIIHCDIINLKEKELLKSTCK